MKEEMKLVTQQAAFARDVSKLIAFIFIEGYGCTFGEAHRTVEQAIIYAHQGKGIADSLHCKRLAVDLNLFSPQGDYLQDTKSYEKFGLFWERLSPRNRWGGRFKRADGNHFERVELYR